MHASVSSKQLAEEYSSRIWNKKDFTAIQDLLDPEIVIHSLLGDYHGQEAMKKVVDSWLKAFPDLIVTNKNVIAESDLVVIQWGAQGTHRGEFKNIKPTGKQVSYEGVSIYKIKDHKIVEYWGYLDMQHLFNQIK